jgi:hypothetical protein
VLGGGERSALPVTLCRNGSVVRSGAGWSIRPLCGRRFALPSRHTLTSFLNFKVPLNFKDKGRTSASGTDIPPNSHATPPAPAVPSRPVRCGAAVSPCFLPVALRCSACRGGARGGPRVAGVPPSPPPPHCPERHLAGGFLRRLPGLSWSMLAASRDLLAGRRARARARLGPSRPLPRLATSTLQGGRVKRAPPLLTCPTSTCVPILDRRPPARLGRTGRRSAAVGSTTYTFDNGMAFSVRPRGPARLCFAPLARGTAAGGHAPARGPHLAAPRPGPHGPGPGSSACSRKLRTRNRFLRVGGRDLLVTARLVT